MSAALERQLRELREISESIRVRLAGLEGLITAVNDRLDQLATVRPELALTLIADVIMRGYDASQPGLPQGPAMAACVRVPGGVGIALWREHPSAMATMGSENCFGASPVFVPFADLPPMLQRLLIPHLEQVLESLPRHTQP